MIICITGLPGSGKSTVASLLQKELESQKGIVVHHYTTDWMRLKLFPELANNPFQHGRDFTPDELEKSYSGLCTLFEKELHSNKHLILLTDGTYRKESQRDVLRKVAERYGVPFALVKVEVREDTVLKRIQKRFEAGEGSGCESYLSAKMQYEEPVGDVRILNNTKSTGALKEAVKKLVQDIWR